VVSSVDFTEDVRLSETILTRLTEAYRKLRNTFRNALGTSRFRSPPPPPSRGRNARIDQ